MGQLTSRSSRHATGRQAFETLNTAGVVWPLLCYVWASPNTLIGLLFVPLAMLPRGRMQVIDGVLEAHGPLIAALLRHCVPIPSGASAITFGHVVLARDSWALEATRAHERVHVRQCEFWGPAFIPAYLIAGLWALMTGTGAYAGNYFERQAIASAGDRQNWRPQ